MVARGAGSQLELGPGSRSSSCGGGLQPAAWVAARAARGGVDGERIVVLRHSWWGQLRGYRVRPGVLAEGQRAMTAGRLGSRSSRDWCASCARCARGPAAQQSHLAPRPRRAAAARAPGAGRREHGCLVRTLEQLLRTPGRPPAAATSGGRKTQLSPPAADLELPAGESGETGRNGRKGRCASFSRPGPSCSSWCAGPA